MNITTEKISKVKKGLIEVIEDQWFAFEKEDIDFIVSCIEDAFAPLLEEGQN